MGKTKNDLTGASSLKCQLSPPPLGNGEETKHFLLLINSTPNALYPIQLKMTEVFVETCFVNLKVLSFSLNF